MRIVWALMAMLLAACASGTRLKGTLVTYPEAAASETRKARRYAVVIGIGDFRDDRFSPLRYARSDADAMALALAEFDEVSLLADPGQVDRKTVLATIDRLVRKAQLDRDVVLVYISAHGTLAYDNRGQLERYIVAADTDERRVAETGIAVSDIVAKLESARAKRRALILAFCHSGEGKSRLSPELETERQSLKGSFFVEPIERVSEATVVLGASAWGETAREDDHLQHDIYTHFFLEGLSQGDANADGAVTITEAHEYARERTYYYTRGRQRPSARMIITGADPIVLRGVRKQSGLPIIGSMAALLDGADLWVDGRRKGSLPGSYAVPYGAHAVEIRRPGAPSPLARAQVQLGPDEVVDVVRLVPQPTVLSLTLRAGVLFPFHVAGVLPKAMPSFELAFDIERLPWQHAWLELGLGGSLGRQSLGEIDSEARWGEAHAGGVVGAQTRWQRVSLRLGFYAGCQVLWRSFAASLDLEPEATVSPLGGLAAGAEFAVARHLSLGLLVRGGLTARRQDGALEPTPLLLVAASASAPF